MNTVIQQLAEQAAEFAVTGPIDMNLESEHEDQKVVIPATFIAKFAELLVRECATLAYDGPGGILEHFGVEE